MAELMRATPGGVCEGDRQVFPVHEVPAARVTPHREALAYLVAVGIELIEDVIEFLVVNESVGVVHPPSGGAEVVHGPIRVSGHTRHLAMDRKHGVADEVAG